MAEDAMIRRDVKTSDEGERFMAGASCPFDRVVAHQGMQGPPEALMMGYGLNVRNGMVCHACVADQASIAEAVLETVALRKPPKLRSIIIAKASPAEMRYSPLMTISRDDRMEDLKDTLKRMVEDVGEQAVWRVDINVESDRYKHVKNTTWKELLDRGLVKWLCPGYYQLTVGGWRAGVQLLGWDKGGASGKALQARCTSEGSSKGTP